MIYTDEKLNRKTLAENAIFISIQYMHIRESAYSDKMFKFFSSLET